MMVAALAGVRGAAAPALDLDSGALSAPRPVYELLEQTVRRFPKNPAMEFMGRRWTYGDLGQLVAQATKGLQNLGVGPGVQVGLCLPNTPYSIIFFYAILRAGGTVVNFNPLYVERELQNQINDSASRIMVTVDVPMIYRKVSAVTGLDHIILCRLADALPAAKGLMYRLFKRKDQARPKSDRRVVPSRKIMSAAGPPTPVTVDPATDLAVLQYTGGTTGVPKGAMLTHANLSINCEQIIQHVQDFEPGKERILAILPLFHVFAMTAVMNIGVRIGAEIILLPKFDLDQTLDAIEHYRPTIVPGVPTLFSALSASTIKRQRDLSSITKCISGGAPLPQEVRERFEKMSGCHLLEGYGLSESSPVVTVNPVNAKRNGSAGVALPQTQIEIRDIADPAQVLKPGECGELYVRGPQVMAGYWRNEAETRDVLIDGTLRTGDLGYLDADGYLFLTDRLKDLIICSGYNVYPRVLEEALYQHPDIREAVVIGVADEYRGQAPKAFVTVNPGSAVTADELKLFVSSYVSKIEMPKSIEIRESLPRTTVGKLSRKELVAEELAASKLAAKNAI
jgi:long-chain acyl-CoA synthetase